MQNWGEPTNPLLSTLKFSTKKKINFEALNRSVVLDLEWLLLEESLQRARLSRLLEGEFESFVFFSLL